jgi:hypothetical protein
VTAEDVARGPAAGPDGKERFLVTRDELIALVDEAMRTRK